MPNCFSAKNYITFHVLFTSNYCLFSVTSCEAETYNIKQNIITVMSRMQHVVKKNTYFELESFPLQLGAPLQSFANANCAYRQDDNEQLKLLGIGVINRVKFAKFTANSKT
jgi:hypothetical protein